jgi:hypothetical protein
VHKVVLVAGSHKNLPSFRHSAEYVLAVADIFRRGGIEPKLHVGQHPDDDFIHMAHSPCFIPAQGGFSDSIVQIVTQRGGTVL